MPHWLFYYAFVYNLRIFTIKYISGQRNPSLNARLGRYKTRVWGLKVFEAKQKTTSSCWEPNSMFLG